jgi:hypothetical protein
MSETVASLVRLLAYIGRGFLIFAVLSRWIFGQRIAAMMGLTWKAAFRFRLFLVVTALLLASVVALPLLLKDDGTARGFTQILLTYTLSTISALLGLSTLWLACGTLARDIEECQIQLLAVKPIARWQIWLGKWLGLMSLNAALLAISGASVFCLLQWRATRLPPAEQKILRNEVLVARTSAKEVADFHEDIEAETERIFQERIAKTPVAEGDRALVRNQIHEQIKAEFQLVPPGYTRYWEVKLGTPRQSMADRPVYVRIKFNSADKSPAGTFIGLWQVGVPQKTQLWRSEPMSLAPDTFHEFQVPPFVDADGLLTVTFVNPNNTALLFPLEDGFEVLYREGGFALNFVRGLGIILCWMGLLTTLGLASASFLSFPVAAFCSLGILSLALFSGPLATAVSEGTLGGYNAEKGPQGRIPIDVVAIPVFKAVLNLVNLAKDFSPIDSLSTGRSITWTQLARAFGQIILLLGGVIGLFGIAVFARRELATAQGTQ